MIDDSGSAAVSPETHLRAEVRALEAYRVQDSRGLVKLDAMENPYPWPGELQDAWKAWLSDLEINRYPDPRAEQLKDSLRDAMGIPKGAGVLLGNGSDEIIQILAMAFAIPGGAIIAPDPSFVMYRMVATFLGLEFVGVPLGKGFRLDAAAVVAAGGAEKRSLTFLAQPNNPTGNLFDAAGVRHVIRGTPGIVVVDEAYYPFTDETLLGAVLDYPNLLVMRTVSKLGLAGLRLGVLVGAPRWIDELEKLRMPYNVNTLTQVSAEFALRNADVLAEQARRIREDRDRLIASLARIGGVTPYPSDANFVMFRTPPGTAGALFLGLRERGVLTKNLAGSGGALADCLRVTVGTPAEIDRFLEAFEAAFSELPGKLKAPS